MYVCVHMSIFLNWELSKIKKWKRKEMCREQSDRHTKTKEKFGRYFWSSNLAQMPSRARDKHSLLPIIVSLCIFTCLSMNILAFRELTCGIFLIQSYVLSIYWGWCLCSHNSSSSRFFLKCGTVNVLILWMCLERLHIWNQNLGEWGCI